MPKFSTTTPTASAVHELGLMDSMQHYFSYRFRTKCGISKVKLLGTLEDWELLKEKAKGLE